VAAAHERRSSVLVLIGVFKLLKAALLILVGVGALRLLDRHRDVQAVIIDWLHTLHLGQHRRFAEILLARAGAVSPRRLKLFALLMLVYAALFTTEGVGLILARRWAEYLTIVTTSLLLPLEFYELARHLSVVRVLVLALNITVVIYLIWRVQRDRATGRRI